MPPFFDIAATIAAMQNAKSTDDVITALAAALPAVQAE